MKQILTFLLIFIHLNLFSQIKFKIDSKDCYLIFDNEIQDKEVSKITWNGNCVNNYANGKGFLTTFNNNGEELYKIEVEIKNGKIEGFAKITFLKNNYLKNGTYEGEVNDLSFNGKGKITYNNQQYEGNFVNGVLTGKGRYLNILKEDIYEGTFVDWKYNGNGKYIWGKNSNSYGQIYEGEFKDGKQNGYGIDYFNNIKKYEGLFINGKKLSDYLNYDILKISLNNPTESQTINVNSYINPIIENNWSKTYAKIDKIDTNQERTLVYYTFENPTILSKDMQMYSYEINTFRFSIPGEKSYNFCLIDELNSNIKYNQIKHKDTENLPTGKESKEYVLRPSDKITFILAFEPLKQNSKNIGLYRKKNETEFSWDFKNILLLTEVEKMNYLSLKEKEKTIIEFQKQKKIEESIKEQENNKRIEIERLAKIKSQIENRTFNGSHFYDYATFKYIGDFKNGIPNGQGKWEKPDGSWYSGQFIDGVENGIGTLRQKSGLRYTGNFINGVPNGNFKIVRWTLMGLAKDEWDAVYENGKLISSSQTETGMTDFLSGKNNNSFSSNSNGNSNSNCENENISNWSINENGQKSNGIEKYFDYTVKFDDGFSGNIEYFPNNKKWYFDTGTSFKKYNSKENAIRALYIWQKCSKITEKGKE